MALTRAEREARFKAEHGVSSGTYYEMRRKAADRGLSPSLFDKVRKESGYDAAKTAAQAAAVDVDRGRYEAAKGAGIIGGDVAFSDFDTSMDTYDIPDDVDWWYH